MKNNSHTQQEWMAPGQPKTVNEPPLTTGQKPAQLDTDTYVGPQVCNRAKSEWALTGLEKKLLNKFAEYNPV